MDSIGVTEQNGWLAVSNRWADDGRTYIGGHEASFGALALDRRTGFGGALRMGSRWACLSGVDECEDVGVLRSVGWPRHGLDTKN